MAEGRQRRSEDGMKISARNVLKGKVTAVKTGAVAAQVQVDVGGHVITSMISRPTH